MMNLKNFLFTVHRSQLTTFYGVKTNANENWRCDAGS